MEDEEVTTFVQKSKKLKEIPNEAFKARKTLRKLDLSLNEITTLPIELIKFSNLTELRLRGNNLGTFPDPILDLQKLKLLDLSDTNLTEIPYTIACLRDLKELSLNQNKLSYIPAEIGQLINLEMLSLTANRLRSLPDQMSTLSKLTFIDISNNNFYEFPQSLGKIPSLRVMWLYYNNLYKLKGIEGNKNLNQLRLYNNNFTTIPKQLLSCTNLVTVEFDNNLIKSIPPQISDLRKLKQLTFSNCLIQEIPEEITKLTALSEFIVIRSRIAKLPKFMRKFSNLCNLILIESKLTSCDFTINNCYMMLDSNELTSFNCIQDDALQTLKLKNNKLTTVPNTNVLSSLYELDLSNNFIYNIDQSKFHSGLCSLRLTTNKITIFPEKGIKYSQLTYLNLCNNHLQSLPSGLFTYIPMLKNLNVAMNLLINLPTSLTSLERIEELNLSHNQFAEFPDDILQLTTLTNLYLTNNYLAELPNTFSRLSNLEVLDLSCNYLTSIDSIIECTNISSLSAAFNTSLTIPTNLDLLTKLKEVSFIGTRPLEDYPLDTEVIKKMLLFEVSYMNTEKRESQRPQTVIHTPLLFMEQSECNQLKLPLSSPQFEETVGDCPVEIGTSNMCGLRDQMQDTMVIVTNYLGVGYHLLSLFDGHGGTSASCFCASEFPERISNVFFKNPTLSIEECLVETFRSIDSKIKEVGFTDGSSTNIVLVTPKQYIVANCGDSRCILVRTKNIVTMNEDHTVSNADELDRIKSCDGFVDKSKVNGQVVLTRTLGDVDCEGVVDCTPQITCIERSVDDLCVVLCCDGVFDVLTNEIVGDLCRKKINESASELAASIRDLAYASYCKDNISVIVCKLMS